MIIVYKGVQTKSVDKNQTKIEETTQEGNFRSITI